MTGQELDRRHVVNTLLSDRGGLLVVTGLGSPAWDVMAAGDHDRNFYLWGAMGGAAMIGLGLALARPEEDVVVITGDGEQLMALGALATIAAAAPANLSIVVLDNHHYGETGMQKSHTGFGVDLAGIARASGFAWSEAVTDMGGVDDLKARLTRRQGPGFASVLISAEEDAPRVLPPRDGVELKNRFRRQLGYGTI
jgi:thiamine pyrophosphate-dependent acetolactate synthase large subunit-like protein